MRTSPFAILVYICLPATYLIMMKNGNSSLFYLALLTFLLLWLGSASSFIPWLNKKRQNKKETAKRSQFSHVSTKWKRRKKNKPKIHKWYTCIHVTKNTTERGSTEKTILIDPILSEKEIWAGTATPLHTRYIHFHTTYYS